MEYIVVYLDEDGNRIWKGFDDINEASLFNKTHVVSDIFVSLRAYNYVCRKLDKMVSDIKDMNEMIKTFKERWHI